MPLTLILTLILTPLVQARLRDWSVDPDGFGDAIDRMVGVEGGDAGGGGDQAINRVAEAVGGGGGGDGAGGSEAGAKKRMKKKKRKGSKAGTEKAEL